MKGLPLAYGKDMQEDKEPVFDAVDSLKLCVAACAGMIGDLKANAPVLQAAAGEGYTTATDLADWCVRKLNMPFRSAHHVAGRIVRLAESQDKPLEALTLAEMQKTEEHTSELQSLMRISYAVFCLKKKKQKNKQEHMN